MDKDRQIARISCPLCGLKGIQEFEFPAKIQNCFKENWHECKSFIIIDEISSIKEEVLDYQSRIAKRIY